MPAGEWSECLAVSDPTGGPGDLRLRGARRSLPVCGVAAVKKHLRSISGVFPDEPTFPSAERDFGVSRAPRPFLADNPAADGTRRRRVTAINAVHTENQCPAPGRAETIRQLMNTAQAERIGRIAAVAAERIARIPVATPVAAYRNWIEVGFLDRYSSTGLLARHLEKEVDVRFRGVRTPRRSPADHAHRPVGPHPYTPTPLAGHSRRDHRPRPPRRTGTRPHMAIDEAAPHPGAAGPYTESRGDVRCSLLSVPVWGSAGSVAG